MTAPRCSCAATDSVGADPAGGDELADRMVTAARAYAGSGASHDPQRYLALLMGPGDTDKNYFLNASSCGLYARGVMRVAGVDHPILQQPYRITHGISDVFDIARSKGAFVAAKGPNGPQPRPGDIVWMKTPGHDDDHVEVITAVRGPWTYEVAAGGQGTFGNASGLYTRSPWKTDGTTFYAGQRTIMGWVDARKLAAPTLATPQPLPVPSGPAPAQPSAEKKSSGATGLAVVMGGLLVVAVGVSVIGGGWRKG